MAPGLVARRRGGKWIQPLSGNLVNGPRSLVQNNGLPLVLQSANSDFEFAPGNLTTRSDTLASPIRLSERSLSAG